MDRWLKGDRSARTGPQVEVQDSDQRWRTEQKWPPVQNTRQRTLYMSADGTFTQQPTGPTATATLGPSSRNRYFYLNNQQGVYNELPIDRICTACATFTYDVRGGDLRIVGTPTLGLRLVPRGPSGHVAAFLLRVDRDDGWHLIGWGASDLRFPRGGYEAQPVTPGEPVKMTLPLQPLDAVVHDGEQLLLILDQGHADHFPGLPFFPVDLEYGSTLGTLELTRQTPRRRQFFEPPPVGERWCGDACGT